MSAITRFQGIRNDHSSHSLSNSNKDITKGSRTFSSHSNSQIGQVSKVLVVSGAGGNTAREPIIKFINNGFHVIGLTTNKDILRFSNSKVQYVLINKNEIKNPEEIKKSIDQGMKQLKLNGCSDVVALNLIGTSVAPKGSSLEEVNKQIPLLFFKSIAELMRENTNRISLVQISSISASLIGGLNTPDAYARIKKETDEEMLSLPIKGNICVLRPGIIMPNPTAEGKVDMGHEYSPEQFAQARCIPVLGSGNQIQQPVSTDCLYQAAFNVTQDPSLEKRAIVNAVSPEVITQKEMYVHFNNKIVRLFVHVPFGLAHHIATDFPLGRVAPYSVEMLKTLDLDPEKNKPVCSKDFEAILGRKAIGFREFYNEEKIIVTRSSPIPNHLFLIFKETLKEPSKGMNLVSELVKSLPQLSLSTIAPSENKK